MADDAPESEIIYVPGGPEVNRYIIDENVIILDEALKIRPCAHKAVLEHEREHARIGHDDWRAWFKHVQHDFTTDWNRRMSTSREYASIREYVDELGPDGCREAATGFIHTFINEGLRGLWQIPMVLLYPIVSTINRFR